MLSIHRFVCSTWDIVVCLFSLYVHVLYKGRGQLKKKRFLSGIGGGGGGLPMPKFFGPLFISAFLVNKKSLFLQKCI